MKKTTSDFIMLTLLLFIPYFGFTQEDSNKSIEKNEKFSDSTIIYGKVITDGSVSNTISPYCFDGVDEIINDDEMFIISGAVECKSKYPDKIIPFYEIIFKKKFYFIKKENVITINDHFNEILNLNEVDKIKFRENAKYHSDLLLSIKLEKAINFLKSCKSKGLAILTWSFYDESEYTDGTSTKLEVYNPTNKTIKYLWFSFIAYNAVDDIILNKRTGSKITTTKGVGPIKPENNASYDFEYVWFTDLVEKVKISQIKIQYMDGTFKTVLNPKEITLDKEYYNLLDPD